MLCCHICNGLHGSQDSQSLINGEITEIAHKIAALDAIRKRLEQDLLDIPPSDNGRSPGESLVSDGESVDKLRFVICRYTVGKPRDPLFWRGQRDGFIEVLDKAKTYQSEARVKRQIEQLRKDPDYVLAADERLSYKSYRELIQMVSG